MLSLRWFFHKHIKTLARWTINACNICECKHLGPCTFKHPDICPDNLNICLDIHFTVYYTCPSRYWANIVSWYLDIIKSESEGIWPVLGPQTLHYNAKFVWTYQTSAHLDIRVSGSRALMPDICAPVAPDLFRHPVMEAQACGPLLINKVEIMTPYLLRHRKIQTSGSAGLRPVMVP